MMIHSYFLWRNVKGLSSHVNLLIDVHTGYDEEDPRPPGSPCQQPPQPEDDGPLVLLDHLHHEQEGEGEGDHYEQQRSNGHDEGTDTRTLLANWNN